MTKAMKKITALTKEQEARFPEFVDKWLKIGLSTVPADRSRAEAGIRKAYEIAGLKAPPAIIWCGSPLSMAISHSLLKRAGGVKNLVRQSVGKSVEQSVWQSVGKSVEQSVGESVEQSVWQSVGKSVEQSVDKPVWQSVGKSVEQSVWQSVGKSVEQSVDKPVWQSVGKSVEQSVWQSVGKSVEQSVGESVWQSVYGQHDAGWLSFYDYFSEAVDLRHLISKLDGIMAIAQSAGWWLPCENICFISERHNVCRVDDRGLIHCENGPAIQYPDGFSVYSWHGVRIPDEWVSGKKPSAKDALTWENMEQRRAACEIVGWHNILRELNARSVDKDDDPQIGELIEVELPDVGKEKFLRVMCGTKREFALPVPPTMKTALESQAWIHNVPDNVIRNLEVRT
jgi:hypothetical protein